MEKSLVLYGEDALGVFTPQRVRGRKQSGQNSLGSSAVSWQCGILRSFCLPPKSRGKDYRVSVRSAHIRSRHRWVIHYTVPLLC